MKTILICLLVCTWFPGLNEMPERTLTGTVTSSEDGSAMPGVNVMLKGTGQGTVTNVDGRYSIRIPDTGGTLTFSFIGFESKEVRIRKEAVMNVQLSPERTALEEVIVSGHAPVKRRALHDREAERSYQMAPYKMMAPPAPVNTEVYEGLEENIFYSAAKKPLSTFSIDVDAASYANLRRFINNGQRPPKDAVRIEEMINYFSYAYAPPSNREPFSVTTEISDAPWNKDHRLVHIGLQGKKIPLEDLPASNLVFLIDVSGSMNQPNKLPLVRRSFQLLVDQLRPQDHVAIVVYAGAAGTVLAPTPGDDKRKIIAALDKLQAGGSTAGGAGLRMAYALAREHFKEDGNNRVILASDGDFNVGESSNQAMEDLIEEKRKDGVFLTVLGFGMGNLKDSKMEILADKGNGNYAYIDNLTEARKVLVSEFGGTLFTIAKDVKLQVEFNPARVQAYRLIGYENRKLNDEDFNNDRKDAGELGSGHTVTALYEIIPVGVRSDFYAIDQLKYQVPSGPVHSRPSGDWLTVKLRYKDPAGSNSKLMEHVLSQEPVSLLRSSENFRWAAVVAGFGMLLTESQYIRDWDYRQVEELALNAKGADPEGYRSEFINLVRTCGVMHSAESRR